METKECAGLCTEPGLAAAHAAYHARLLARARRIVVDPDLAEDVVQEAFLRAWRACGSFNPEGGPMVNWLLVITARTAIDMVKARVRRPPLASVPAAGEGGEHVRLCERQAAGGAELAVDDGGERAVGGG